MPAAWFALFAQLNVIAGIGKRLPRPSRISKDPPADGNQVGHSRFQYGPGVFRCSNVADADHRYTGGGGEIASAGGRSSPAIGAL